MSEDSKASLFPQSARNPLAWSIIFLLAGLAWILTLQQTLSMLSTPMYGTMGMTLPPFLGFWTIMMAAMMLPALAPTVSVQMAALRQQTSDLVTLLTHTSAFLLGYLLAWGAFGIPVFVCCLGIDQLVLSTPLLAQGLGMVLFVGAGLYQFTPQKKRALAHCNPSMGYHSVCQIATPVASVRGQLKEGLQHAGSCLQGCGILMLVLIPVGLMNLFWMLLMTMAIFLEKVWVHGDKLSILLGFVLIFYGLLTVVSPWLLPGLYIQ